MRAENETRAGFPTSAGIYRAVNDDPGVEPITGTAREIAGRLGHLDNYIRHIAQTGGVTKSGWRIDRITAPKYAEETHHYAGREYVAERPDDDPIIGPVDEIAALTGMRPTSVMYLISSGGTSRDGWTIRPAEETP